jgi:hypothetical protein
MAPADPVRLHLNGWEGPTETARQMLADGKTLEDVWRYLRDGGLSIIESKYATMHLTGMSARDAQVALYCSDTWRDLRPAIDQLEAAVLELVEEMGGTVRIDGDVLEAKKTG